MEENYPYDDDQYQGNWSDYYITELEQIVPDPPLQMPNISVTHTVQDLATNVADFAAHTVYYPGSYIYDFYGELVELGQLIKDNVNEIIRLNTL